MSDKTCQSGRRWVRFRRSRGVSCERFWLAEGLTKLLDIPPGAVAPSCASVKMTDTPCTDGTGLSKGPARTPFTAEILKGCLDPKRTKQGIPAFRIRLRIASKVIPQSVWIYMASSTPKVSHMPIASIGRTLGLFCPIRISHHFPFFPTTGLSNSVHVYSGGQPNENTTRSIRPTLSVMLTGTGSQPWPEAIPYMLLKKKKDIAIEVLILEIQWRRPLILPGLCDVRLDI